MRSTSVGPYELGELVGSGGFAQVYRAIDSRSGETVALKILRSDYAEDADLVRRFADEAATAAELPPHPNIVHLREYGEYDGLYYITMDFLDGPDLSVMLERERLALSQAVAILSQLAEALRFAHEYGVVHRDIKPQNIKVGPDGVIKVLDFGIAKSAGSSQRTKTGLLLGTPEYLGPEIWDGKVADARTDIYAWGIVAYQVLTGSPPFTGTSAPQIMVQHYTKTPSPLRAARNEIPPGYEAIVLRALAKQPGQRFQTAAELQQALRDPRGYLAAHHTPTPFTPPGGPLPPPSGPTNQPGVLTAIRGDVTGRSYILRSGLTLLGRAPGAQIRLGDRRMSARHAEIHSTSSGCILRDLGSSNGTYVRGFRVQGSMQLNEGDHIQIGGTEFVFHAHSLDSGQSWTGSAGPVWGRVGGRRPMNGAAPLGALAQISALFLVVVPFVPMVCPIAIWLTAGRTQRQLAVVAQQAMIYQAIVSLLLLVVGLYGTYRGPWPHLVWLAAAGYAFYAAFRCLTTQRFEYPLIHDLIMNRRH